jgi:RNase P protein component
MANLASFPAGSDVVVRALPGIEKLDHSELQNNFDLALAKVAS